MYHFVLESLEDLFAKHWPSVFFMRLTARQSLDSFIVIQSIEQSQAAEDFFFEAVLKEAEKVLQVCQNR